MSEEQILEKYSTPSNQYGWCLPPDQARKAMDEWAREVLTGYLIKNLSVSKKTANEAFDDYIQHPYEKP